MMTGEAAFQRAIDAKKKWKNGNSFFFFEVEVQKNEMMRRPRAKRGNPALLLFLSFSLPLSFRSPAPLSPSSHQRRESPLLCYSPCQTRTFSLFGQRGGFFFREGARGQQKRKKKKK